jgi:hypothetical protein
MLLQSGHTLSNDSADALMSSRTGRRGTSVLRLSSGSLDRSLGPNRCSTAKRLPPHLSSNGAPIARQLSSIALSLRLRPHRSLAGGSSLRGKAVYLTLARSAQFFPGRPELVVT